MSKMLKFLAVLVTAYVAATYVLGLEFLSMIGLIFAGAVVFLAKGFTKLAQIVPTNQKTSKYIGGGLLVLMFVMGGFSQFGLTMPSGTIFPDSPTGEVDAGTSEGECWSLASDELRGKSASVVQNAYDQASNTPNSAAVDVNPTYVYKNGDYHTTLTDTSDASLTTAAVGQVLDHYPAGSTYYGMHSNKCILTQADEVSLDVYTIVSDANMDVTCYDDTGSATLSAAGNTSQSDYDITMGADAIETFYCKWKVNTANVAFRFGGIVAGYFEGTTDTIDQVELIGNDAGVTFIDGLSAPKWTKNLMIQYDIDANTTAGYSDYWEASTPLLMEEWDTIKVQFEVESGGSDPTADTDSTPSTKTAFYLYALDAQWSRGSDGQPYLGTHTNDAAESNVGLVELISSPVGSSLGVAIELI